MTGLPLVGAHVSSQGGPQTVFARAREIEAEAIQMFLSAPQQWKTPTITDEQVEAFRAERERARVPVFFHGVYLINFASQDEALLERSVTSLTNYLEFADRMGAVGTIFHVGSHLGAGFDAMCEQMCSLMKRALDQAGNESLLILENNAGVGNCCGRTFGELGQLVRGLDKDPRVRICVDTCHAFAMGYDIRTVEGVADAMEEFEREIGLDRLAAVHANDSKTPLGGVRDRHENIGFGEIGRDGFAAVMAHPAFAGVPFLLEVPGMDHKGPDLENIRRLRAIRDGKPFRKPRKKRSA